MYLHTKCIHCDWTLEKPQQRRDKAVCALCRSVGPRKQAKPRKQSSKPPKGGWLCAVCRGQRTYDLGKCCASCRRNIDSFKRGESHV